MYYLYAKTIGKMLLDKLIKGGCCIEHIENYYGVFGIYNKMNFEQYYNRYNDTPYFIVDFDYYYITNGDVDKYYTQTEQGTFAFWKYDYYASFPVCCKPSILFRANNKDLLIGLKEIINNDGITGESIGLEHPLIANNKIVFKMKLSTIEHTLLEADDYGMYTMIVNFETVNIPWFLPKLQQTDVANSEMQEPIIRYIEALFRLKNNLKKKLDNGRMKGTGKKATTTEQLTSIDNIINSLLNTIGIPNHMRDIKRIREIELYVHKEGLSICQAIDEIEKKIAEARRVEKLKQEKIEKQKREQIERERCEQQEHQVVYYGYDDYYEQDDYSLGGGMIKGIIKGTAEYVGDKFRDKNIYPDLIGSHGCIKGKKKGSFTQSCNFSCPLWEDCARGRHRKS